MADEDAGDVDTLRPFTRADALAAGIDPRLLRGSKFRRIFKGVYVSSTRAPSAVLRAEAALTVHPLGAYVSHHTAARVYELPVPHDPLEHVTVLTGNDRRRRKEIRCHVAEPGSRVATWRGVRVSTPVGLFIELSEYLSLVDLVIAGDALARRGWITPAELVEACSTSQHRFAATALREARYVRKEVDSPMETRLRMLIVEYDGRQHAEDPAQYASDSYRREDLDRWGWRLWVVTAKGIFTHPHETLIRVRAALIERGARGVRRLSDEWRTHFPAREPVRRTS